MNKNEMDALIDLTEKELYNADIPDLEAAISLLEDEIIPRRELLYQTIKDELRRIDDGYYYAIWRMKEYRNTLKDRLILKKKERNANIANLHHILLIPQYNHS